MLSGKKIIMLKSRSTMVIVKRGRDQKKNHQEQIRSLNSGGKNLRRVKVRRIAEALNNKLNGEWFHVLVSERYEYNEMLKASTEETLREGLFDENFLSTTVDVFSVFNNFSLNKDLCREIEANMNTEHKEGIDQFVLSHFNNAIDTPYQPLFYNNCAMWIQSTKMKWQNDVDRKSMIEYFRVHSVLLERGRI